ncbi:MAG: dynamin family protein [Betaproteobacteria bacterium]|nr:MAG: dynamin family protein [Betaproteobacteria bacterium]
MRTELENQVANYQHWRDKLRETIEAYQAWLESNGQADIRRSLRIYDLVESLRNDRVMLAFLAEFSRGKTELINAMFFSSYGRRLLPSEVGRTTMCPTEIFYDSSEEPYLRLLPIETRRCEDSIRVLKHKPVEWVQIRLDVDSQEGMAVAMSKLADVKTVTIQEAEMLGLLEESEFVTRTVIRKNQGKVEVPCWRHAMINFPHPLLKSGLIILDTPGVNALGTEPELTLSMIPSAHAVLFLLALDTGVTKSDLKVWQDYVCDHVSRRIAVVNKVDLAWDDLKSQGEIEASVGRQLAETAQTLELSQDHVIALSAQKALVARIREDAEMLQKSGIEKLERLIANEIIASKQQVLRGAVCREVGGMVESSLRSLIARRDGRERELLEMSELSGKNRDLVHRLVGKFEQDKAQFGRRMKSFKMSLATVNKQGNALLGTMHDKRLAEILARSLQAMEGSWTTAGLMRSMQSLIETFSRQAENVLAFSAETRGFVDNVYSQFHKQYGFKKISPPALDLERHILHMHALQQRTEQFCKSPVNVLGREKRFVIRRFHRELVDQGLQSFRDVRSDLESWLEGALTPLSAQLREHQRLLEHRVESLRKITGDANALRQRVRYLEKQQEQLNKQISDLMRIQTTLSSDMPSPRAPSAAVATGV